MLLRPSHLSSQKDRMKVFGITLILAHFNASIGTDAAQLPRVNWESKNLNLMEPGSCWAIGKENKVYNSDSAPDLRFPRGYSTLKVSRSPDGRMSLLNEGQSDLLYLVSDAQRQNMYMENIIYPGDEHLVTVTICTIWVTTTRIPRDHQ